MGAGATMKLAVGIMLIFLSQGMGKFFKQVLTNATISIQGSEMLKIDGYMQVFWVEQRTVHYPKDQDEFEDALRDYFDEITRDVTLDRWGEKYVYELLARQHYTLVSYGPDKEEGTEDDLLLTRIGQKVKLNKDPVKIALDQIDAVEEQHRKVLKDIAKLLDEAGIDVPELTAAAGGKGGGKSGGASEFPELDIDATLDALDRLFEQEDRGDDDRAAREDRRRRRVASDDRGRGGDDGLGSGDLPGVRADGSGSTRGNNGLGNGQDPAPSGNAPSNDGAGSGPGDPGTRGGVRRGNSNSNELDDSDLPGIKPGS